MFEALTTVTQQPDAERGRPYAVTYVYFDGICLFSAASRKLIDTFQRRFSTNFLQWAHDRTQLFQAIYKVLHQTSYKDNVTIEQGLLDELDALSLAAAA